MAVPPLGPVLTPAGFTIFSAQGVVQLSWNQTPLATTFYINRSTDNITFTNIAQTASLNYSDASGVVDTIYYYTVQASNGTFSGLPTNSLAGISLKPGETTVGNMRLECQQRISKENSQFYTNQEWNSMLAKSYKELYDILVQKFGDDYYVATPYTYTLANNLESYPLPADFYKLLLVEVALNNNDPHSYVTLCEYQFIQKNLYNYPNVYTMYGITNLKYRLNGTNLSIIPAPTGGQTLRIWYAPRPNQLINDTDIIDGVSGWEEYIVVDACIKALAKEESDVSVFAAQKSALLKRIEEAGENRNIGEPERVSDSRRRNFAWGDGGGSGFSGGSDGWY